VNSLRFYQLADTASDKFLKTS